MTITFSFIMMISAQTVKTWKSLSPLSFWGKHSDREDLYNHLKNVTYYVMLELNHLQS